MTLPSSLDRTISPRDKHVATLFVQYAPYTLDPKFGNWADPRCVRTLDLYSLSLVMHIFRMRHQVTGCATYAAIDYIPCTPWWSVFCVGDKPLLCPLMT
jgi:hypothetical protein